MRGIEQFLQVDAATLGALKYAGTWNASTNTPTLASGVGVQGQYYVVSVAGSTNLDGETAWQVGDWAVFNGSVWQKVDGGSTGLLTTLTVTGNTYLATTSGSAVIGATSAAGKFAVVVPNSGALQLAGNFTNNADADFSLSIKSGETWIGPSTATPLIFANTANTERMRITSAGDVGIGITNPSAALTVYKGAAGADVAYLLNSGGYGLRIQPQTGGSGTNTLAYVASGESLSLGTNNTERVRITTAGDVGIGTSSPAAKFEVANTSGSVAAILRSSNSGYSELYFADVADNAASAISYEHATNILRLYNGGSARVYLDSSGNLGLGVTPAAHSPSGFGGPMLQVGNRASLMGSSVYSTLGNNVYYDSGFFRYIATDEASMLEQENGAFKWFTAPSGTAGNAISFTQAMTLDASGNLGVGTSSPATKLHVNTGAAGYGITVAANTQTSVTYQIGIDSNSNLAIYDTFATAQRLVLSTAGNLGLGVTPSAWSGSQKGAIDLGQYGAVAATNNIGVTLSWASYYSGTGWVYKGTGAAPGAYVMDNIHRWYTAPSGTAGNAISFTEAMRLDASGNLGLGVTPSAWSGIGKTLQIDTGGSFSADSANAYFAANAYYNGTNWIYQTTNNSARYNMTGSGQHQWFNAPSGTAGNAISFTQAMTLDASGNLGVGSTSISPAYGYTRVIEVAGQFPGIKFSPSGASTFGFQIGAGTNGFQFYDVAASTERMRIPSAGGMVVGAAALATNATDGFLYVPTCAGTPTGTPTTQTGTAPIVIDTTNNKLYFYSGGQWRDAGP